MYRIRLAPLCGVTDYIFRSICYELGCELAYTEMISAMGYLCAPNQQATRELMIRGEKEPRLILQLFGKDPDVVAEAARRIEGLGVYDGIDLNMGCPARKVACSGEGCGLMRTPETAEQMIRKTVAAVRIPVTVKMRIGWDREHINAVEFARMAEAAGASEITVHGRTREQQYSGDANWDIIAEVKQKVHIPVTGNGDIFRAEDAIRRIKESKVDSVMIGRGALGNPWIFRDIRLMMNGGEPESVTLQERQDMIRRHYSMMLAHLPEHIAVREMRKHIGWYLHGLRGAARVRAEINRCTAPGQVSEMLNRFFECAGDTDQKQTKLI